MAKFLIEGGTKLSGKIKVAGNKNSVLPIMAACLLTEDKCIIENVPKISDVSVMAQIMELCGAKIEGVGKDKLEITCQKITPANFPTELTEKLRASVLLLGPMLARTGRLRLGYPGGDVIGRRSLETHIKALESLGAQIKKEEDSYAASAKNLVGKTLFLKEASVTATENVILASVLAKGKTKILRAASEPHVVDLCQFLVKMGAKITGIGSSVLEIEGVEKLSGATHSIRPDHIEVGTFAILAAVTKSNIEISPIVEEDLNMILLVLSSFGINYEIKGEKLIIKDSKLEAVDKIVTDVWPGFPTDLMAPMIVLATQAHGVTLLHDWMYESRMFFVDKLISMGAKVEIADPHRVMVYGPTTLRGQRMETPDIRAGIALVIAAIVSEGKSKIEHAELIERGYENITERLSSIGVKIKREN